MTSTKYNRTLHAPISLGATSDDRIMPTGYLRQFADMSDIILLEKIDGQNNCFNKYGVFARSHAIQSQLEWDKPLIHRWNLIKNDLADLEIFGENVYAIHSIGYKRLESFFYVFAARIKDTWLSWDEVSFYAALFDFPTVPIITLKISLKDFYNQHSHLDEDTILRNWLVFNLGQSWEDYVNTSGCLGGYDTISGLDAFEGFVGRNVGEFKTNNGILPVSYNEFDSVFKIVRPRHVKTDQHWTRNWRATKLINYQKYLWNMYEY